MEKALGRRFQKTRILDIALRCMRCWSASTRNFDDYTDILHIRNDEKGEPLLLGIQLCRLLGIWWHGKWLLHCESNEILWG